MILKQDLKIQARSYRISPKILAKFLQGHSKTLPDFGTKIMKHMMGSCYDLKILVEFLHGVLAYEN